MFTAILDKNSCKKIRKSTLFWVSKKNTFCKPVLSSSPKLPSSMLGVVKWQEEQFHVLTLSQGCGDDFYIDVNLFATILSKIVEFCSSVHACNPLYTIFALIFLADTMFSPENIFEVSVSTQSVLFYVKMPYLLYKLFVDTAFSFISTALDLSGLLFD